MLKPVSLVMRIHDRFKFVAAFSMLLAASPLLSQVQPSVATGGSSLSVGSSFALFNADLGKNRLDGVTVWGDWQPKFLPRIPRGLGIELQVRDLSFGTTTAPPAVTRLATFGGGPVYTYHRYPRFRPYAKLIFDYGEIDWANPNPVFKHETRTVYAPGGGFEARVFRQFWFRTDYEYQFWQRINGYMIDPQGFSFGVSYHLNRFSSE